jgi:Phytanoyl-CoA dioxygenase (PhyH)
MRKIFLDGGLQNRFLDLGYVHVPMLSAGEVAHIVSSLATLRPADNFAPSGETTFGRTYHCSFLDKSIEYKRQTHELIKGVFAPHIDRYMNGYEILNCNFYVKPPGTGEFVIHQNWPAIADLNDTTVTVWCPLLDVVAENGTLQFVEGSHKILPHVEGPTCPGYFDKFRPELIRKYLKPNPMSAGEALIFDDGLIHWSANNSSDKARVAIQILCVPKDAQPVYFFYDKEHPERFELIAVDSDFYVNTSVAELVKRQPQWTSLGFVENRNRYVSEEEFVELLARGREIREQVYAGVSA